MEALGGKRGFPYLQRMHQGRFVIGIEDHQMAVLEQCEAMANQGHIRLFPDQVVSEQNHLPGELLVEHIQHVLTVR